MDIELLKGAIGLAGTVLIVGLVQMFKPFVTDERYYPFIAVGFGLIINLVAAWAIGSVNASPMVAAVWVVAVLQGIMGGLAASGLYSAASTIRNQ